MGEMKIKISEEIEKIFRKLAMQKYGYQRGALSDAAEEAFYIWISAQGFSEQPEDPIKSISGLMKNVKETSLSLQHNAWKNVGRKYPN